jgi:AraC-like DNA-binding protein
LVLINIEYTHSDYNDLIKLFAKSFNAKLKDNTIFLPQDVGNGFIKLVNLSNGLQAIVSNFYVFEDITFSRKKSKNEYFTLRVDEVILPKVSNNNHETDDIKTSVFLMNAKFDWFYMLKKGSTVKSMSVQFSKDWLDNFLGAEKAGLFIKKYLSLKTSSFNYEPLDAEYKRILLEIIEASGNNEYFFNGLVTHNRIMLLLERFFFRVYKKMSASNFEVKISSDDLQRLVQVEHELLKDFSVPPPGIPKLARMAAMSPSKLKTTFKEIYGLPIYQYFQKHRMNKAKAMLLSKKYNVKEVGMEVGFSNLSNFAKAFKKSFDQLPSDILIYK